MMEQLRSEEEGHGPLPPFRGLFEPPAWTGAPLSVIQTTTELSHMPVLFRALVTLPTLSSTTDTIALKVCSSGQLDWCSYRAWKRCGACQLILG